MIRVLVLGVGGNVSQGIIKALRKTKIDLRLIGACISPNSAGLYMCDEAYLSPYAHEEQFMDWLIDICNKCRIDIVFTGVEENICRIAKDIDFFKAQTRAVFVSSDYEQILTGQDKLRTALWLKDNGCNYPQFCSLDMQREIEELVDKLGFPLIAKPRKGKSAQGIYIVNSRQELDEILKLDHYVLQEYIGNDDSEYTVGCYCSRNRRRMDVIIMHRILKNGTTVWAEVVKNEKIRREAEKICRAFKPRGPLNIQMRLNSNGEPVCFELNVRFSGTTAMRANFGFCDVEAMVREYVLGESIDSCFQIVCGEAYRYSEEMYIFGGATEKIKKSGKIENVNSFNICFQNTDSCRADI